MKKLILMVCAALAMVACNEEYNLGSSKNGNYSGVLQTTSLDDGKVFTDTNVEFSLTEQTNGRLTLTMHDTHFVENMPRLTMNAADIVATTQGGEHLLSCDPEGIVPTIMLLKYEKYIITNLHGKRIVTTDHSGRGALSLSFHCRGYLVEYIGVSK